MAGNTFRTGESVVIDAALEGIDTSISDVTITIVSATTGATAISGITMEDEGNQKYRFVWDTRLGYSEVSGYSGISAYSTPSGIIYSGYTTSSGYSADVSGIYIATITARDANDHRGSETFRIRIA